MASAHKIGAVSTLADSLSDPERISALPKDVIAELRGQIAKLDTLLLSRLLAAGEAQTGPAADGRRSCAKTWCCGRLVVPAREHIALCGASGKEASPFQRGGNGTVHPTEDGTIGVLSFKFS